MILKGLKAPFYVNPTKLKLPRLGIKDVKIDLLFDLETIKNVHISELKYTSLASTPG